MTPQRRAEDAPPSGTRKAVDRTLAAAALAFSIGFLYQLSEVLAKHTCWCDFVEPAGVGEIVFCLTCGLGAISTSLGLNVPSLLKGFRSVNLEQGVQNDEQDG